MTATAATPTTLPLLLCEVEVVTARRISPSFVRVELGGPGLADLGVDGPRYDQRIKLVFPDPLTGGLVAVAGADEEWLSTWLDRPVAERGHGRVPPAWMLGPGLVPERDQPRTQRAVARRFGLGDRRQVCGLGHTPSLGGTELRSNPVA